VGGERLRRQEGRCRRWQGVRRRPEVGRRVRPLEQLSPFELKDELIRYARDSTRTKAATHKLLNAGRGNPNWIATTPREAFFLLGSFAMQEARLTWNEPELGLAGMPRSPGI